MLLPRKRRKISLADDSLNYEGFELARLSALEENGEDLEALKTLVLDYIMHRMAEKGLDLSTIINDMIFRNKKCLTALELCEWLKLLDDPFLVSTDCVERLLGLRNSTFESSPKELPVTTFYIRTYALTVAQLNEVIEILLKAKITFKNKIFAWKRIIVSLLNSVSVHLRYAGVSRAINAWGRHVHDLRTIRGSSLMRILHIISDLFPATVSNCLVQKVPYLELPIMAGDQSIDMREQMLIRVIEQGALNVSIGGSVSSNPNLRGKDLFQNLETRFISIGAQMTQEVSLTSRMAIRNYA